MCCPKECPDSQRSERIEFLNECNRGARLSSPRRHMWNSLDQHNRDHLVKEQLANLHGHQDHVDQPLRNDRDVDDLHVRTCTTAQQGHQPRCQRTGESQWFSEQQDHGDQPLRKDRDVDDLWNSHDLHNRGIDRLVHVQLVNHDGPTNSVDHGTSKQGHGSPCQATGESLLSDEKSGPWEPASAPRQEICTTRTTGTPRNVQQLWNLKEQQNSLDHGDDPL